MLTELEGAVLSELHHRGQETAFQVRRAFATSPSLEWKGSAGAVYPAVRRLEKSGLIHASIAVGGRARRGLRITDNGKKALMAWACDATRGSSVGIDPFRLRAGIWTQLTDAQRRRVFGRVRSELEVSIQVLSSELATLDPIERKRVELAVALQRARLAILDDW